MHVSMRQLKAFAAVSAHMSFTRAAEDLNLTQPAVSMQIKQLEQQVGQALFEQVGKKLYLTEAGREVRTYARLILQQLDNMAAGLASFKGLESGTLSISVATTAHYFAPKLLSIFCQRYPGVNVKLDVTNRETLLQQLENNTVDMVIMGRPPEDFKVEAGVFMENPLVLIAPPTHPFSREKAIQLERLEKETFLVREKGSGTRKAMEKFFENHGIHMTTGMEVSSDEAIKRSVQAGLGLGIMSRDAVQYELQLGHLIIPDILHFPIMRHWYVMHREGKRLSPIAEAFKAFLLEEAAIILKKEPSTQRPSSTDATSGQHPSLPPRSEDGYVPAKPQNLLFGPDGKPIPPAPSKIRK
ncbi:MAG: LysR family transcriptional regulator [Alphaproteobacteria bacterium]|nr:LysR family transcriptional regulator [Alphaproteobacteria bacterium]MBF0249234.1 LysR family transcriptional regulator [Alphaproteobacteria bacterium]